MQRGKFESGMPSSSIELSIETEESAFPPDTINGGWVKAHFLT